LRRWVADGDSLIATNTVEPPNSVGAMQHVVVSRDGQRALVVGSGGTAVINLLTGVAVESPGGGTTVVAPDPSGRFVAIGGSRLAVWDLDHGERVIAIPQVAAALDWSAPCDQAARCKLVAGGVSIDVFDPFTETQVRLVDEIGAQSIAISPDGARVASGGWGDSLAVWSVGPSFDDSQRSEIDGRELEALPQLAGLAAVTDSTCRSGMVAASPNGRYAVTVDPTTAVTRLCSTIDGGTQLAVAQLSPDAGEVTAIAVDDNALVALGRSSGIVETYPFADGAFGRGRAIDVRVGGEQIRATALAARGGVVVAGITYPESNQSQGRVVVWRLERMEPTSFAIDQHDIVSVAVLDAVASAIVVASRDEPVGGVTVQLWDTATRRRVGRALSGLSGELTALAGVDTALVGADTAAHMFRWEVERDPTRDVCAIAGRHMMPEEWDSVAGGALQPYAFDDPCD
jgi:WD40 repeat protein